MIQKMRIKQSLTYWCLNGTSWAWDIDRICQTVKQLGCQSVELAPHELWPKIRSYGLDIAVAMNGMPNPVFAKGLNNPRYAEEVIATTKLAIDRCAEAGVTRVLAFTGHKWTDADDPESPEIPLAEGAANTIKNLRELANYAEPRGVTLCLEQLNTRDDSHPMKGHPGYQGDDIDYCAQIILSVGSPNAKLLFDIYHVAIMNGDIIRRLSQYRDLLGHIHTAGVPGRAELDENQEINYPAVMRTLLEIGYEGYVGQEFIPTKDPSIGLAQAVALCNV
jgi:sugar phosphate isomerase/epimerase